VLEVVEKLTGRGGGVRDDPGVTFGQGYCDGAEQIACEVRGSFKHEGAELRGTDAIHCLGGEPVIAKFFLLVCVFPANLRQE